MTGERLRDELARIADDARPAHVPDDTWARSQRARRRGRAGAVALAAVVVALVAGLLVWSPHARTPLDPADGTGDGAGVPSRLWAVPTYLTRAGAQDRVRDAVGDDLATGRAAAAWTESDRLLVVVDARSGDYDLVDLDAVGLTPRVALSPDGTRLASLRGKQVVVADLVTGAVETVSASVTGGLRRLAWSDDGTWLAWVTTRELGRVLPDAGGPEATRLPGRPNQLRIAVDDEGGVLVVRDGGVTRWDGRDTTTTPTGPVLSGGPVAVSPTGGEVAVGYTRDGAGAVRASFVDPTTGEVVRQAQLADIASTVEPLGWLDDTTSVWRVDDWAGDDELVLVDGDGSTERVGTLETSYGSTGLEEAVVPADVSVAVGLMTPERPTVERPEPDWPRPDGFTTGLLVLLGVLGTVLGALVVARRTRDRAASLPAVVRAPLGAAVGFGLVVVWGWFLWTGLAVDPVSDPGSTVLGILPLAAAGAALAGRSAPGRRAFGGGVVVGSLVVPAALLVVLVLLNATAGP